MAHLKTHSCFFVKAIPRQKNFLPMTFSLIPLVYFMEQQFFFRFDTDAKKLHSAKRDSKWRPF